MWNKWIAVSVLGVALSSVAQVNLRPEVAKPLQAAQEAIQAKQPEEALKKIQQARAVEQLSEPERLLLERLSIVAAMNAQKFEQAAASLDYVLQSKSVSGLDRFTLMESMLTVNLRLKNYPQVVTWGRRYVAEGGPNRQVRLMVIQALAVQGQHAEVLQAMAGKRQLDAATGQQPDEAELRIYAFSQQQLKDERAYVQTLTELVQRFPSKDYWEDLLDRVMRQPGFNARLQLDVARLQDATEVLQEADDYLDMVQFALKAGLPHEAKRALDKAEAAGLLGKSEVSNQTKIKQQVLSRMAEDDKASPPKAEDGAGLALLAELQLSKGQWQSASQTFDKALAKGGVRRESETRLHAGLALFKSGQTSAAKTMWASVQGDESAVLLAKLWTALAK